MADYLINVEIPYNVELDTRLDGKEYKKNEIFLYNPNIQRHKMYWINKQIKQYDKSQYIFKCNENNFKVNGEFLKVGDIIDPKYIPHIDLYVKAGKVKQELQPSTFLFLSNKYGYSSKEKDSGKQFKDFKKIIKEKLDIDVKSNFSKPTKEEMEKINELFKGE
jgi:hypothetical protein